MNSQEELQEQLPVGVMVLWDTAADYTAWDESDTGSIEVAAMNSTDDTNALWELNQTMIYTAQQAKALADESVALAEASAKAAVDREGKPNEPLSEDEKARLWRAVLESCSG